LVFQHSSVLPRIVKGDFANSSICWFFKKIGIIPADEIAEVAALKLLEEEKRV
jgi:hypothetical protein